MICIPQGRVAQSLKCLSRTLRQNVPWVEEPNLLGFPYFFDGLSLLFQHLLGSKSSVFLLDD